MKSVAACSSRIPISPYPAARVGSEGRGLLAESTVAWRPGSTMTEAPRAAPAPGRPDAAPAPDTPDGHGQPAARLSPACERDRGSEELELAAVRILEVDRSARDPIVPRDVR